MTANSKALRALQGVTPAHQVAAFLALVTGYFLLGTAGLQLQSAQTGVTPVWPASGFALAMVYWFGLGQVLAILPAMLLLAATLGVPAEVAAISAMGSMLEAGVPAYLLRRLGVDPALRYLRDTLLFVAVGPLLGPVFSATAGTAAFHVFGDRSLDLPYLWLLWWLGNSIGLLVAGGFGLVVVARRSLRLRRRSLLKLWIAGTAAVIITAFGLLQVVHIASPLVLFLLIPVFVLISQDGDQYQVLLLGMMVVGVMLLSAAWLPPESLLQTDLGILYLDVSLLWVVAFTGMVAACARQEMRAREQVSWLVGHDPLTRLLNRHAFMERLEQVLSGPRDRLPGHALLFLDLDRFKDLNDAEGHRGGDQVLRDVGVLLGQEVRQADTVARLGGDEFGLLLEGRNLLDACATAENIRSVIERYEYRGRRGHHRVEASIGLLQLSPEQGSPEDVLHAAESACDEAKRAGRNRVWVLSAAGPPDGQ